MSSLVFVGDSHIRTMKWAFEQKLIPCPCEFIEVGGASSIGLRNPNSQTNAIEIFKQALLPFRPGITPIIHLGEVDCGFVIWWRAMHFAEPVEDQLAASVAAYFDFVDHLIEAGYTDVILTGATLPAIRDGQDWGDIANARRDVTASLADRTGLTMRYNEMVGAGAADRGVRFVDISGDLLDNQTQTIAEEHRHPDPTDHHLNPETAGAIWAARLNEAVVG